MAKKDKNSSAANKTAQKKKSAPKKTGAKVLKGSEKKSPASVKSARPLSAGHGMRPFFVLTIMALIIVIAFLMNKIYYQNESEVKKKNQPSAKKENVNNREQDNTREKPGSGMEDDGNSSGAVKDNEASIYFIKMDDRSENMELYPVIRKIEGSSRLEGAIRELIKGLSKKEKERGLLNAVPFDLKIRGIKVVNRTALIDFNSSIEKGASGNILLSRLDQIVYTATQFEEIENIIITINGKRKETLGSDGLSISGPLHRRK